MFCNLTGHRVAISRHKGSVAGVVAGAGFTRKTAGVVAGGAGVVRVASMVPPGVAVVTTTDRPRIIGLVDEAVTVVARRHSGRRATGGAGHRRSIGTVLWLISCFRIRTYAYCRRRSSRSYSRSRSRSKSRASSKGSPNHRQRREKSPVQVEEQQPMEPEPQMVPQPVAVTEFPHLRPHDTKPGFVFQGTCAETRLENAKRRFASLAAVVFTRHEHFGRGGHAGRQVT